MVGNLIQKIKVQARLLKMQIAVVYLAYKHKDTRWYQRAFLLLILIYAVSPIDLIPDFIPIIGMLDDIILIPLGIFFAVKMIPKSVWEECKKQAEDGIDIGSKYKKMGVILIILIWLIALQFILKRFL